MAPPAIVVEAFRKTYGEVEAVAGIDFTVAEGEIFGLLGPNGAGKTTTLECLEGLRTPTEGRRASPAWGLLVLAPYVAGALLL